MPPSSGTRLRTLQAAALLYTPGQSFHFTNIRLCVMMAAP